MNFKYLLDRMVTLLLLPLMYYQGKKIRAHMPILPEAEGTEGVSFKNSKKTLKLITIGDSCMAGVGVGTHKEGFIGTLADELAAHHNTNLSWKVYAKSGYTATKIRDKLIPCIQDDEINLIVIGVGGNDAFKLTPPNQWINHIKTIISNLRNKYKYQPIIFINMPPVREIPAFTPVIRYVTGNLLDHYSTELVKLVKELDGVFYCSSKIRYQDYLKRYNLNSHSSEFFSPIDKFHPSKLAYQIWAKDVFKFIIKNEVVKK